MAQQSPGAGSVKPTCSIGMLTPSPMACVVAAAQPCIALCTGALHCPHHAGIWSQQQRVWRTDGDALTPARPEQCKPGRQARRGGLLILSFMQVTTVILAATAATRRLRPPVMVCTDEHHACRLLHRRGQRRCRQAMQTAWRMAWTACSRLPGPPPPSPKPMQELLLVSPIFLFMLIT